MFKSNPLISQILTTKSVFPASIIILLTFIGSFAFSTHFKVSGQASTDEQKVSGSFESAKEKASTSCCSQPNAAAPDPYTLVGSYYSLKENQETTLMFNNKGLEPLVVNPAFFSLNGERLELPAFTILGTSYKEVDLRELLAEHLPKFSEGSLQVTHRGKRLQLGAQFKILKDGILFDEQFITPATRFPSQKMESVWWMPSSSKTKFIVSNTTDTAVIATITVDGTAPKQKQPTTIQLNPHQTRVLDILQDLVGKQNGTLHKTGGISITHDAAPGALMARMLIFNQNTGFSAIAGFVDPTNQHSSKLNGGGLRLGSINGDDLEQVIVAKNAGDQQTTVRGRIPYTNENGDVVFVTIPEVQLEPHEIKTLDVKPVVQQANISADVRFAGLELEYTTVPGSVVMNALSVSKSGQQVFQLPLLDPERMPSSAGGFPWKVDGDYTTVVFIKNETDVPRKYVARLTYEGGEYTLGLKMLKPRQTAEVDFKELRDKQKPDLNGQIIPLNVDKGQIAWTMLGGENNKMSGRSEQVNAVKGISSTYACYNCCPDNLNSDGSISMFELAPVDYPTFDVDDTLTFGFMAYTTNCYDDYGPYFLDYGENWFSSDTNVATIESYGFFTAMGGGDALMSGLYPIYYYTPGYGLNCNIHHDNVGNSIPISARPTITSITPNRGLIGSTVSVTINGSGFRSGATTIPSMAGITVSNLTVNTSRRITADFIIAANATGGNRSVAVKVGNQTSRNSVNFFVQIPTSLKVLSKGVYSGNNILDNGCPSNQPYGFRISVRYQVLDQDSTPKDIDAAVPIKENLLDFMTNGQPSAQDVLNTSVVTGDMTQNDGTFTDQPIGACAASPFVTSSFTQELFTPISNDIKPIVKTNNWVFTGRYGCGNMTNGNDISVSVPCS